MSTCVLISHSDIIWSNLISLKITEIFSSVAVKENLVSLEILHIFFHNASNDRQCFSFPLISYARAKSTFSGEFAFYLSFHGFECSTQSFCYSETVIKASKK